MLRVKKTDEGREHRDKTGPKALLISKHFHTTFITSDKKLTTKTKHLWTLTSNREYGAIKHGAHVQCNLTLIFRTYHREEMTTNNQVKDNST